LERFLAFERSGHEEDLRDANSVLSGLVVRRSDWSQAWFALGLVRLAFARAGKIAMSGPLQAVGESNEAGAVHAFVRALELRPGSERYADALARAPVPREGVDPVRLSTQRKAYGLLSPPAKYAASIVELTGGSADSAIALLTSALGSGVVDTGLVDLALARAYYRIGSPEAGLNALLSGVRDTSAVSLSAYRQSITWVASPTELADWDRLRPDERPGWLNAFWASRDVRAGRSVGARLIEHYRRWEFALAHYAVQVPQTGRHRVSSQSSTVDYFADELYLRYLQQLSPEDLTQDDELLLRLNGDQTTSGDRSRLRAYMNAQTMLDDRGIIYLRYGAPDKSARTNDGLAYELWRYELPSHPLILYFKEEDFDGQAGASVLTPTLLAADPRQRDQLCHLDLRLCSTNADPSTTDLLATGQRLVSSAERMIAREARRLSSDDIARAAAVGNASIRSATTTDDFSPRFSPGIPVLAQILGLRTGNAAEGRILVPFALQGDKLQTDSSVGVDGRVVYPLHFRLIALRKNDGSRFQEDTARKFVAHHELSSREYLVGLVSLEVPSGNYSVSLVVTQSDGRGSVVNISEVVVPPGDGILTASDLVLGREESGVRWNSGRTAVPLNPLNAFSRTDNAEVYVQLSGLKAGESYRTTFEFFRSDDDPKHAPRLRVASSEPATATWMELQRSIGLKNLDPGRYRVEFTVSGAGGSAKAVGWMTVTQR
jgi:hypothetical protein